MTRCVPLALLLAAAPGCGDADRPSDVRMDFPRVELFDAPFPSGDLYAGGTVDLSLFENPTSVELMDQVIGLIDGTLDGASTTSAVYFSTRVSLAGVELPGLAQTVTAQSPVFLFGINPESPDYLRRYPIEVHFEEDGGPFATTNLLSLLPLQGVPLRADTEYAAVVMRSLADLNQAGAVADAAGGDPAYRELSAAIDALRADGIEPADVAAIAAFRTHDPTADMRAFVDAARQLPTPVPTKFAQTDLFDNFCVYEAQVDMPVYQQGTPPFSREGGDWPAEPELQTHETARIVVTIPRTSAPPGGYPTVVMIRTGGGGDRPLVDRGPRAEPGGEAIAPGTGPALHFANVGFAGVSVDGPHGGVRNVSNGDEQLLMFNIQNAGAIRDNVRQSALEIALLPDILPGVAIDLSDCPGAQNAPAVFDLNHLALMGHSMGATIAPLTLAVEPRFGAVILSGAGGSWIENIVHKISPLTLRPLAGAILGYTGKGRELFEHDIALSLVQWAIDSADTPPYARFMIHEAPERAMHVLMFQGVVDTYILPPIANATTLSAGLDLGGSPLDTDDVDAVSNVLGLVGRSQIELPASGNLEGPSGEPITGVVVQHAEGPIEDGHEVMFQTDSPKAQYEEFLRSWTQGTPTVIGR